MGDLNRLILSTGKCEEETDGALSEVQNRKFRLIQSLHSLWIPFESRTLTPVSYLIILCDYARFPHHHRRSFLGSQIHSIQPFNIKSDRPNLNS